MGLWGTSLVIKGDARSLEYSSCDDSYKVEGPNFKRQLILGFLVPVKACS